MYVIIKRDKSHHLKEKLHEMKMMACELAECFEACVEESKERFEHDYPHAGSHYARGGSYYAREDYDNYDSDYNREYARGRSRSRY